LEHEWTGQDVHIFFSLNGADSYRTWYSSPDEYLEMLRSSPPNVHYFWLSQSDYSQLDVAVVKVLFELGVLWRLPPTLRSSWRSRLHFVPKQCSVAASAAFAQAVCGHAATSLDRFQRWRETGYLGRPSSFTGWYTSYLAHEALYFNAEFDALYQPDLAYDEIRVLERERYVGGWSMVISRTVDFPTNLDAYDGLSVELLRGCPDEHDRYRDASCDPYDRLAYLKLCDEFGADCREIARWTTPFARQPHHLTDISPMLSLLRPGGRRVLQYYEKGQSKGLLTLRLRLHRPDAAANAAAANATAANVTAGMTPQSFADAWSGTVGFGPSYGADRGEVSFHVPPEASRVEMVVFLSGHGWGSTGCSNCAEFCNSRHVFRLNGGEHSFEESFPEALENEYCLDPSVISTGVVPNQYGTWGYGRAGWCPGLDVVPHRIDLTDVIIPNAINTMTYDACLMQPDGSCVAPCSCYDGYCPEIAMGSYVIFYG